MNTFFVRRYVIAGIFITIILILLAKLFYIQIIDKQYSIYATKNVLHKVKVYPARGPILDRNGKILVENEPSYDIMVTPKEVRPFDTAEFCKLLNIDKDEFNRRMQKAIKYSRGLPSPFEKQISIQTFAALQERLSEFPGFSAITRYLRTYPDSVAAQFLGYIGEVTDKQIKESNGRYQPGDYVGITGVERSYEDLLRGQVGIKNQVVDSRGVAKGSYANGAFDTAAVAGARLTSSLDIRIQKLGEQLMKNKLGSIVAIEPSTGEILCFVSSPTYDPNLMVGRERGNNAAKMYDDPYDPFLVRPIQAYYPPGSSFKPLSALIALQNNMITPQTSYDCRGVYWAGNHPVPCYHHEVHGIVTLSSAVAESCNGYFSMVFEKVINAKGAKNTATTFDDWRAKVAKFGLGSRLGLDLPSEGRGNLPKAADYDKIYPHGGWRSSTVISLAIGQGELLATPLQLANIECTIANRGYYYKPHLIKGIGDKDVVKPEYKVRNYVGIDSTYFNPLIDGMQAVVDRGTAARSKIPGIIMCGKTGTAQNPHGSDHSVFVAFAPRNNPKIAIAVVVENGGEGGKWAAPIASFIVEKYLRDSISTRESGITPEQFMNANLMPDAETYLGKRRYRLFMKADSLRKAQADSLRRHISLKSAGRKKPNNRAVAYNSTPLTERREK